jgi:hypothetical protein
MIARVVKYHSIVEWNFSLWFALLRTHLINRNGCVARNLALRQGERRENILYGSLSDEQRRRGVKDRATLRAEWWRAAGGVAPQSQNAVAMLLRRALPVARHHSAHPVPIYEMGSSPVIGILLGILGVFLLYH